MGPVHESGMGAVGEGKTVTGVCMYLVGEEHNQEGELPECVSAEGGHSRWVRILVPDETWCK
jgi:hypothetical protein